MDPDDGFRAMLTEAFAERGMSPASALALAGFVDGASRIRMTAALARKLKAGRRTVPGEAFYRAVIGDDGESLRDAAARLFVSPGRLCKLVEVYRSEMSEETGMPS